MGSKAGTLQNVGRRGENVAGGQLLFEGGITGKKAGGLLTEGNA